MRRFLACVPLVWLGVAVVATASPEPAAQVGADCTAHGKKLAGRVKVVHAFPDLRVKRVDAFEDLRVKWVDAFPDSCGRWQRVDAFSDFTIQYVDAFPDITIRSVDAFPGVPKRLSQAAAACSQRASGCERGREIDARAGAWVAR